MCLDMKAYMCKCACARMCLPMAQRGWELQPALLRLRDKHLVILAQLRQEVVQRFDGACAKDLVQDGNFSQELACDLFEATRKLSDVSQGYLQVVAEVRILVTFQSRNNRLEN